MALTWLKGAPAERLARKDARVATGSAAVASPSASRRAWSLHTDPKAAQNAMEELREDLRGTHERSGAREALEGQTHLNVGSSRAARRAGLRRGVRVRC